MKTKAIQRRRRGLVIDRYYRRGVARTSAPAGTAFSLTVPVANSAQLTASSNITLATCTANGSGNGTDKGDKCEATSVSITSGDIVVYQVDAKNNGGYSYLNNITAAAIIVRAPSLGNEDSPIGTHTPGGGNTGDGSVVISGTAASVPAFTCPTLIYSIDDNGSGKCRITTFGAHGLSALQNPVVSGTSVTEYNGSHEIQAVVNASTFDTDVLFHDAIGLLNSAGAATAVGLLTLP